MKKEIKEKAEQASIRYAKKHADAQKAFMAGVKWMEKHNDNDGIVMDDRIIERINTHDTPEMVDIGLPSGLKWAKWNVGATKESEYGKLFAWGDTVGYDATSEGCPGKFSEDWYSTQGLTEIVSDLALTQDAANVAYGGCYRMPNADEFKELNENTTYSIEKINGIKGGKFTAKNGNYIFFPFAGYIFEGFLYSQGYGTNILSSSYLNGDNAWIFYCDSHSHAVIDDYRGYGFSIRAVCKA